VTYNIIESLRGRHEITIVSLVHSKEDEEIALKHRDEVREIKVFRCRPKWDAYTMARSLFSRQPYKAIRFRNPDMAECVRQMCSSGRFDLIHAQNYYAAQYVPVNRTVKAVQYKENFESKILRRYAETRKNPLIRAGIRLQSERTRRFEIDLCRRFDRTLVISPVDLEEIRKEDPEVPIRYSPASIDTENYRPSDEPPETDRLVYVGGLDYFPNYDGLLWFYREVFPDIVRRRPKVVFEVVGRGGHPCLSPLKRDSNIRFTGRVPDVRPHVKQAAVYVVPLRIGGGIKLKILEAMAMGKAVVTTPVGAEGIEATPGRDLRVADDSEGFTREVLDLLEKPGERMLIEQNARRAVEKAYAVSVIIPRLEETYVAVYRGDS
jgi:glycosyltransferase involved in cell wall biosynthesis